MTKKSPPSPKPPLRRSHLGCLRCRTRKIHCDERHPVCTPCLLRRDPHCTFSLRLKWAIDYARRGKAFGRAGVWSKSGKGKRVEWRVGDQSLLESCRVWESGFLNVGVHDFEGMECGKKSSGFRFDQPVKVDELDPVLLSLQLQRPTRQLSILPHSSENHLLSYYLNHICPLATPHPSRPSPFSALLFPLAQSSASPAILHAMLGIAASHRARFDSRYNDVALNYATQATQALRITLQQSEQSVATSIEPLVLTMLLCQLEVTRDHSPQWVLHLRGARSLIRLRRQFSGSSSTSSASAITQFVERYFAFCDVMGRTACGEEPIFGNDFWNGQSDEVDAWMGCSPKLVSVVSAITELNWKYSSKEDLNDDELEELRCKRLHLGRILEESIQCAETFDDIILAGMELRRLTVQLYLFSVFDNITPNSPQILTMLQQIFRLIYLILPHSPTGLTWPIFMAACLLDPHEELEWATEDIQLCEDVPGTARAFVLWALEKVGRGLTDVGGTRRVIEKVWIGRELGRRKGGARSDWERFVALYCHNVSLV